MSFTGRPDEDPGWGIALRGAAKQMASFGTRGRPAAASDGLVLLRSVVLAFLISPVGIAIVVAFLASGEEPEDPMSVGLAFALLSGQAALALTMARLITRARPLVADTDETLALSYRTQMFLRIALAESVGLVGFVLFFLTGEPILAWVGLAVTFLEILLNVAPTRSRLEREEEALRARGAGRSLVAALRTTSPPAPR